MTPYDPRRAGSHDVLVDDISTYVRERFGHDPEVFDFSINEPYRPDMLVHSLRDSDHKWWIDAKTPGGPNLAIAADEFKQQGLIYHCKPYPVIYVWRDPASGNPCDATWDEMVQRLVDGDERPGVGNGRTPWFMFRANAIHTGILQMLDEGATDDVLWAHLDPSLPWQFSLDGRAKVHGAPTTALGEVQKLVLRHLSYGPLRAADAGTIMHFQRASEKEGDRYPDHRFGPYTGDACCRAAPIQGWTPLDAMYKRGIVSIEQKDGRKWYHAAQERWR